MAICEGCKKLVASGARTMVLMREERCYGYANQEDDETSLGTWKRIDLTSESIVNDIATITSATLNPERAKKRRMQGSSAIGGDISAEFTNNGLAWLITQAIGKIVGAGTAGDPYTIIPVDSEGVASDETAGYQQDSADYEAEEITYDADCSDCDGYAIGYYTINDYGMEPGFTLWISRDGGTIQNEIGVDFTNHGWFQYRGMKVNTWTLGGDPKGVMTTTFGLMGRDEDVIDKAIPLYNERPAANDPFSGFNVEFELDGSVVCVTAFELSVNNNLDGDQQCFGDRYRNSIPEKDREVTGSITLELSDLVYYKKYTDGDDATLSITFDLLEDGTETLKVVLPKIEFNGTTPTAGGPDIIPQELPFVALWDDSPADNILTKGATLTCPDGFDIAIEIVTAGTLV